MIRLLVVDDEQDMVELIKQKFRKKIKDNEYEFDFSFNGVEALEKLKKERDYDIVMTDINMPEMDGLTLLSQIDQLNLDVKSIIISAYGDMDNIRKAMNFGAFDFITKPVDFNDLESTINKTIKYVIEHKKLLAIEQELNIAQSVQKTILTSPSLYKQIEGLDIDVRYIPMNNTLSGDYYHIDRLKFGIATVLVSDASGHGLQAALSTMQIDILNKESFIINYPNERLSYINHLLVSELKSRNFFTCFAIDIYHDKILFSSAGHITQYLYKSKQKEIIHLKPHGKPIGFMDKTSYKLEIIPIEKNDIVFLFTDGMIEVFNTEDIEFGEERFLECLKTGIMNFYDNTVEELNQSLINNITKFRNNSPITDDITLITIKIK